MATRPRWTAAGNYLSAPPPPAKLAATKSPSGRTPRSTQRNVKKIRRVQNPTDAPATNYHVSNGFIKICLKSIVPSAINAVSSLPRGNSFGSTSAIKTKVPVTMQKWNAAKNRVRCYQVVIRGTWKRIA